RAYDVARQGLVDELGYGGQAGGGKTDLALGLAGNLFQRSMILRREFPQLEEVIDRGDEIYPAGFVGGPKQRWRFGKRIVTLRPMQHEKDWRKYKGQSRDFMCFDEAAEFTEKQVRSLTGWTRTSDPHQKTLVLYCFNPPTTPEGEWIVRYFAPWLDPEYPHPAEPGEVRWFARLDDVDTEVESGAPFAHAGEVIYPISRTFIPASRHDNP
ncbi:MAG: terminase, partial [bacterium]|nr:terminase [bacterium]